MCILEVDSESFLPVDFFIYIENETGPLQDLRFHRLVGRGIPELCIGSHPL